MTQQSLKVATFNIHHAAGTDGIVDLKRTAEVIRGLDADLVALQELDARARRSRNVDQPSELADLLNMHVYFAPMLPLDNGEYGIALAGREPFKATVQMLPRVGNEEPRGAIIASWRGLAVVATHLSRNSGARKKQTEALASIVETLGPPALILGDLNQRSRDLGPLTSLGLNLVKPTTGLRAFRLKFQIDHILHTDGIRVVGSRQVSTEASDHQPLVAEIGIDDA